MSEFARLENIRQAIAIEQNQLEELYGIKRQLHSLTALTATHSELRQAFEQEQFQKKEAWEKESAKLDEEFKEKSEQYAKTQKRKEDEYNYAAELERRKDQDLYQQKKIILERELEEMRSNMERREQELSHKESVLKELETKVAVMPEELAKAVAEAEGKISKALNIEHEQIVKLKEKEYNGTIKLHEQQIAYLQSKIKEQDQLIKELTLKANLASEQVQNIAYKALETSAQRISYPYEAKSNEKAAG